MTSQPSISFFTTNYCLCGVQYGFDAYDASTNNHPEIYPPLEGGSYRPAYKSVAQWQQDKVAADPMQGVTFRNQMGAPYATTNGDIILRGEPQPSETPVYAHVAETDSTTKVVGKLNLLTFEPKEIQVCLVPVNGATLPNIQTLEKELNKIFKPAVASVKLSTHSGITIDYAKNSVVPSMFDGLGIGLGFTLALTLLRSIRELLGTGKIFDFAIYPESYGMLLFVLAPGAFIALGFLIAIVNKLCKS